MDEPAEYLSKSPSAGRMGKATEYLVAATCILTTRGELNVSTSLADDEGVDLVFNRRNSSSTLAVQVKARMSDGTRVASGRFIAFVRTSTFSPRGDLDMLFTVVDVRTGTLMLSWLVPSPDFANLAGKPNRRGRLRFNASMKPSSNDRWSPYRLSTEQLAPRVLDRLTELGADRR
jgi:hypothetical protein